MIQLRRKMEQKRADRMRTERVQEIGQSTIYGRVK